MKIGDIFWIWKAPEYRKVSPGETFWVERQITGETRINWIYREYGRDKKIPKNRDRDGWDNVVTSEEEKRRFESSLRRQRRADKMWPEIRDRLPRCSPDQIEQIAKYLGIDMSRYPMEE